MIKKLKCFTKEQIFLTYYKQSTLLTNNKRGIRWSHLIGSSLELDQTFIFFKRSKQSPHRPSSSQVPGFDPLFWRKFFLSKMKPKDELNLGNERKDIFCCFFNPTKLLFEPPRFPHCSILKKLFAKLEVRNNAVLLLLKVVLTGQSGHQKRDRKY